MFLDWKFVSFVWCFCFVGCWIVDVCFEEAFYCFWDWRYVGGERKLGFVFYLLFFIFKLFFLNFFYFVMFGLMFSNQRCDCLADVCFIILKGIIKVWRKEGFFFLRLSWFWSLVVFFPVTINFHLLGPISKFPNFIFLIF